MSVSEFALFLGLSLPRDGMQPIVARSVSVLAGFDMAHALRNHIVSFGFHIILRSLYFGISEALNT